MDLSADLIERARAAARAERSAAQFEVGDVTYLGFADDSFEAVRCERVFQHLDDAAADAATAEFVRVAKPGGRIYVVDTVHMAHVVDCDDSELFELVLKRFTEGVRDPYAGIRLARRLKSAGVTVRDFEVIARQVPFASWFQGLAVQQQLDALVASGALEEGRARAFVDDLGWRDAAGTFCAAAVGCRALAIKDTSSTAT